MISRTVSCLLEIKEPKTTLYYPPELLKIMYMWQFWGLNSEPHAGEANIPLLHYIPNPLQTYFEALTRLGLIASKKVAFKIMFLLKMKDSSMGRAGCKSVRTEFGSQDPQNEL